MPAALINLITTRFIFRFTSETINQWLDIDLLQNCVSVEIFLSYQFVVCGMFQIQAQQAEVQFCSRLNLLAAIFFILSTVLAVLSKCKEIYKTTVLLNLQHA
ncbi:hypothetical protein T10_13706 [Trichinella papuae]|uniref:Uncharacterized protein n=1 Tax=Trichinella papuae TaxID=268474 RepID=A0A0V1MY29_9BILA|nr:hypothetical protein T10_13706 [Trichinella papuae]